MTSPQITYNPGILGDAELTRSFVVRAESLELVLEAVRENAASSGVNRHLLVIGPRGIGKTMLVRRVAAEIRSNPDYRSEWYPIVFGEESYPVGTPGEFWLEALFHLADQTGEDRWKAAWSELQKEHDDARLRERALGQLLDFADRESQRLLLVVENLNMLIGEQMGRDAAWELRHTLGNEPRLMLLGTATSRFDEITNVDRAWFEMFSIHELKPLDLEDSGELWRSVSGSSPVPGALRAIRVLTGGNPRLLKILASFAAERSFRQLMEQLIHLIDEHTEYFKNHLDNLAPKERKVFVSLLDRWDPVGATELARLSRLGVNEVSALLGRLLGRGAIEVVEQKGRRKLYQAAERLYNVYYLMRRRGHPDGRVRAAVNFMVTFYESEELATRLGELAREACGLPEEIRKDHYLAYAGVLDRMSGLAPRVVECTPHEFFQLPDAPQRIRDLRKVNIRGDEGVEALLDRAHDLYHASGLQEAENLFRQVLERDGKNAEAWAGLGLVLLANEQRFAEAEEPFRKAVELEPGVAGSWHNLGRLLWRLGRFEESLPAFRRAVELDPETPEHLCSLGGMLFGLGHWQEAEQAARKLIKLDPRHSGAWNNLGRTLERLGRSNEAEQAYRKQIEFDPKHYPTWYNLGHLLLETGPPQEAERVWSQALEVDPRLLRCSVHMLELRLERGIDHATILREADDWIDRSKRDPVVLEVMARFVLRKRLDKGVTRAEEWAREAHSKDPNWETAEILMLILAERENWSEALEVSRAVLDVSADREGARESATELLIRAAAAGHTQTAIDMLTASPGAGVFEPLLIGLRIHLGDSPVVAKEILEVGRDVAERIRKYQGDVNSVNENRVKPGLPSE